MGIVNVTPDSFSDGGAWLDCDAAVVQALALHRDGADLVDVGGESTRPGAERPSEEVELARVLPVVKALVDQGVVVTIDTMRAEVARRAVAAGAAAVNDVSGGLADADMLTTVADLGVPFIAMHWRGHSVDMQARAVYADVVAEVVTELGERAAAAESAGIHPGRLVLDPGLGFAKNADHNWELLAALPRLMRLGYPVLVGASRKSFLGELLADSDGVRRPVADRDDASAAVSALLAAAGAWCVRVHTVSGSADAVRVAARWAQATDSLAPREGSLRAR